MFISGTLESTIEKDLIARNGVLKNIKIPMALRNKTCLDFDLTKDEIVITKGDHTYFYTDELGISNETIVVIFFAKQGMVGYIDYGSIYMKDDDGSVFEFNKDGTSSKVEGNTKHITFLTRSKLHDQLKTLVMFRYNLPSNINPATYLDNLAVVLNLSWDEVTIEDLKSHVLTFKVLDYYTDLGMGEFEFKMYPRTNAVRYSGGTSGGADDDEDDEDDPVSTDDDAEYSDEDDEDEDDDSSVDTRY